MIFVYHPPNHSEERGHVQEIGKCVDCSCIIGKCLGIEGGVMLRARLRSAEAARIISETQRRYEYDKYQEHKKEILRKKLLESGKKLFGTHKLWEEAISTKSPLLGPLSKKDPPDFQVGD